MKTKEQVNNLLSMATPRQYLSFLFGLQNSLIALGHFTAFTAKGCNEHVDYMAALKDFFEELENEGQ